MKKHISRRSFLAGCCSAVAAYAGSRITNLAFAAPSQQISPVTDKLVVVFLRGGWDALNVVLPISGTDRGIYQNERPNIAVPTSGTGAAINLNGQFGFHPSMAPLMQFYQAGKLAIIHGVGLDYDTRSHFDAMQFIELGTPGQKTIDTGWLTRHLQTSPFLPASMYFPALSAGGSQAMSLLGTSDAVSMSDPSGFKLYGHWNYKELQRAAIRDLYSGDSWLQVAGTETLDMVDLIESTNPGNYVSANGAVYPGGSFGDNLQAIAQLIKMQVGMQVATVDLGGWDTHENQGSSGGGYFATSLLGPLAQGLAALYTDLNGPCGSNFIKRTTIVVMSEFGRRLKENANRGTDHGHGNVMLVLGGSVKGGAMYGEWPGLSNELLYDRADLRVTTDFRRVLSEIITHRLGNPNIDYIFPDYSGFSPLNFMVNAYPPVPPISPDQDQITYLPLITSPGDDLCP